VIVEATIFRITVTRDDQVCVSSWPTSGPWGRPTRAVPDKIAAIGGRCQAITCRSYPAIHCSNSSFLAVLQLGRPENRKTGPKIVFSGSQEPHSEVFRPYFHVFSRREGFKPSTGRNFVRIMGRAPSPSLLFSNPIILSFGGQHHGSGGPTPWGGGPAPDWALGFHILLRPWHTS
jgi:hypothetical protein